MLGLRLPDEIEERLTALARETGRTKSFYAREAILTYLDDLEDIYVVEKRMDGIRTGKTKLIPLEDVMAEYGL